VNGNRIVFPTHWKVIPKEWSANKADKEAGKFFKPTHNYYRNRNQELMEMKLEIEDLFYRFLRNNKRVPSKTEFRHILDLEFNQVEKEPKINLFEFIDSFIELRKRRMMSNGKRVEGNTTLTTYRQTKNLLAEFEKATNTKVTFESISIDLYDRLVRYMEEERDYSASNVGKHIKTLKTFLNEALERELTTNRSHQSKHFQMIREESYEISLSEDELDEVFNLDLKDNPKLDLQRDFFIVACSTGLRYSDVSKLNRNSLIEKAGRKYIQVKTIKTGTLVPLPIDRRLTAILQKYTDTDSGFPKPFANQTANKHLKEIAERIPSLHSVEIYAKTKGGKLIDMKSKRFELVTTHTGRRTFATLWYLSNKITVQSIMRITGHRSENSFFKYIRMTNNDVVREFEAVIDNRVNLSIVS
jgi:integrase